MATIDLNDDWAALRPRSGPDTVYRMVPNSATDLEDFAIIQYEVVGEDATNWHCRLSRVLLQGKGFRPTQDPSIVSAPGDEPLKLSKSGCHTKLDDAHAIFRAHISACLAAITTMGAQARTALAQAEREVSRLEETRIRMELLSRAKPNDLNAYTTQTIEEFRDAMLDEF